MVELIDTTDQNTNTTYYHNSTHMVNETGDARYRHLFVRMLEDANNDDDVATDTAFKYEGCEELYSTSTLILIVVSVAFLFFTCCMLFEQMDAIETNTSKIARMKLKMGHADAGEYARVGQDFNEFFGGDSVQMAPHWFLPLPIWFPEGKRDQVMGFEYRPEWNGKVYHEGIDDDEYDEEMGSNNNKIKKKNTDEEVHFDDKIGFDENNTSSLILGENGDTSLELELSQNLGGEDLHSMIKKRSIGKK